MGRKPVLIAASAALVVVTYPAFVSDRGGPQHVRCHLAGAVMGALIAGGAAPLFAYMAEMFPTRLRTSSVSIGYNASVMIFGGPHRSSRHS